MCPKIGSVNVVSYCDKRFSKNVGIIAVIDETNAPIIIKILKSIGKLSNTSSTLKARNIKINAELNIKPPIKPPPGLLWPAKKT